jgi:hypothetical protein
MTEYIVIFDNGDYSVKYNLDDVMGINRVGYILKSEFGPNAAGYMQRRLNMALINDHGKKIDLNVGSFSLVDIDYDRGYLTLADSRFNITFQVKVNAGPYKYIHEGVLPIMNRLNELGSYAAYLVQLESDTLRKENEELRRRISELEEEASSQEKE